MAEHDPSRSPLAETTEPNLAHGSKRNPILSSDIEIASSFLMSVAAALNALCAYQATRWSGRQALLIADAHAIRVDANIASNTAAMQQIYDASVFVQLGIAHTQNKKDTVNTLRARMVRDEFRPVFDKWLALQLQKKSNSPKTPFGMPDYRLAATQRARRLYATSEQKIRDAEQANQNGDDYVLATVFLGITLFFAGISTHLKFRHLRWMMVSLGTASLFAGILRMTTLPFY